MSERVHVDISSEMWARANEAVEQGSYATPGEVVDEALRFWVSERDRQITKLRQELAKGFASPMRDWMGSEAELAAWRVRQASPDP